MRPALALYIGGMGARGKNFYNDLAVRYGYEAEAKTIQDLYLDGKKDEAAAAVPTSWCKASSLIGPESYVAERIAAFAEAGVTTLMLQPLDGSREARLKTVETDEAPRRLTASRTSARLTVSGPGRPLGPAHRRAGDGPRRSGDLIIRSTTTKGPPSPDDSGALSSLS